MNPILTALNTLEESDQEELRRGAEHMLNPG